MAGLLTLPQGTPDAVPNPNKTTPLPKDYTPLPLKEGTFTGMLDTSNARLEHNYRHAPLSEFGSTNASTHGALYRDRLAANLALNSQPAESHTGKSWNQRRQEAIARGEDPNSRMIWEMEHRVPDSALERVWRKVTGKKKTVAEERAWQEEKARRKAEREKEREAGVGEGEGEKKKKGKGGKGKGKSEEEEEQVVR